MVNQDRSSEFILLYPKPQGMKCLVGRVHRPTEMQPRAITALHVWRMTNFFPIGNHFHTRCAQSP
jgi:hypothetical protein